MINKNYIWKDNIIFKLLLIGMFLIGMFFALIGIIISNHNDKFIFFLLLLVFIFLIYINSQRRLARIYSEGISLGNITFKKSKQTSSDRNQKGEIIEWDLIKSLLFEGKVQGSYRGTIIADYLYLLKKDGNKYNCLIYDPKGFIETLKKLNKDYLFDKNSKYLKKN
jgi:hypothetical protein